MIPVTLTVNGVRRRAEVEPSLTLLEFLRETLSLTGAKEGCGVGECGACLVLLAHEPGQSMGHRCPGQRRARAGHNGDGKDPS